MSFFDTPDYSQSTPMGMARGQKKKNLAQNRPEQKYGAGGKVSCRWWMRRDKIEEKRRQNLEETEKVATGKFGCEMKGGKWRRKRELCRGGRVNGERSISPWMMRERLTLPGQI